METEDGQSMPRFFVLNTGWAAAVAKGSGSDEYGNSPPQPSRSTTESTVVSN